MVIGLVYVNSMFFRVEGLNSFAYISAIAFCAVYYFSDSARNPLSLLIFPVFLLGLIDLLLAYFVFITLQKNGTSSRPLDRDYDVLTLLVVGGAALAFRLLTNGLHYSAGYGFFGRLDLGFYHPNLAPIWALMLAYYCKHYLGKYTYAFSLLVLGFFVVMSGSLGKVPLIFILFFSGLLFKFRKLSYYSLIAVVLVATFFLMTNMSYEISILTSGRNVIFDQLLQTFTPERLVRPVDREELSTFTAINAWYSQFNAGFVGTLPFDSLLSASVAAGPLVVFIFFLACGVFKCPDNQKDFDRKMLFWAFGFASNPISIWGPLMLFAIKNSDTGRTARTDQERLHRQAMVASTPA